MPEHSTCKLFVSYSCQNRELVEDFIERLKDHNGDFEVLYDQNAASGDVDDILLGYASSCSVALLLINAKFYRSNYCMKQELPLLRKRAEAKTVLIVPVLFQVCDYIRFNQKPTYFFFQARKHQFTYAKSNNPNRDKDNREYVTYEELDKRDRERYHHELNKWIHRSMKENQKPTLNPDPNKKRVAEEIKISGAESDFEKLNKFKDFLEFIIDKNTRETDKLLINNSSLWDGLKIPTEMDRPLTFSFMEQNSDFLKTILNEIDSLDPTYRSKFQRDLLSILNRIGSICDKFSVLAGPLEYSNPKVALKITFIQNKITEIRKLLFSGDYHKVRQNQLPYLKDGIIRLRSELDLFCDDTITYSLN